MSNQPRLHTETPLTTTWKYLCQTRVPGPRIVFSSRNVRGTLYNSPSYSYRAARHIYYTFVWYTRVTLTLSLRHSMHRLHKPAVYIPLWGPICGYDCNSHGTLSQGEESFALFDHVLTFLKDKISKFSYLCTRVFFLIFLFVNKNNQVEQNMQKSKETIAR